VVKPMVEKSNRVKLVSFWVSVDRTN